MIETFEKVLEEIIRVGIIKNAEFSNIGHQGMIGDMYEGLTSDVLRAGLLAGTDTRVCKGKVKVETSRGRVYSNQIDCMVVTGAGEQIPHTDHYIYDINNVIAIVEVKKTLTISELRKSIRIFHSIYRMRMEAGALFSDAHVSTAVRVQKDAFRAVFRRPYPGDEPSVFSKFNTDPERLMYSAIRMSATMPIMIVWGYDGHKTENGFREALLDVFSNSDMDMIVGGPDCILSGEFAYVKSVGMPFVNTAPRHGDFLYAYTQRGLKSRVVLNLLWYRMCKRYDRDFMILSDGRTYSINPLFAYTDRDGKNREARIMCYEIDNQDLETRELDAPTPAVLSLEEWAIAVRLFEGSISLEDHEGFIKALQDSCNKLIDLCTMSKFPIPMRINWSTFDQLIEGVTRSKLFAVDQGKLCLVTSRCSILATKEGTVAFDNRDGAFNMLFPDGLLQYLRSGVMSHRETSVFALFHDPKVGDGADA